MKMRRKQEIEKIASAGGIIYDSVEVLKVGSILKFKI